MRILLALSFIVQLLSARAQSHDLIGYWQNWNDGNAPYLELSEVDPRYSIIDVAFAEPAPGTTYDMVFAPAETTVPTFLADVAALQAAGRKVLISIGGANATVQLNSNGERDQFITSMLDILDTYGFDGMDLDLEGTSVSLSGGTIGAPTDARIINLIAAVNSIADAFEVQHGRRMLLTMAPETAYVQGGQSAFGGIWGAYLPLIDALRPRLDVLHVQLYNSGSMYGVDGAIYEQGTADFIVSQMDVLLQGFTTTGGSFAPLPANTLAVGLPACPSAGGGSVSPAIMADAINYLRGNGPQPGAYVLENTYPDLRGMMTWSINWDAVGTCNASPYTYAENYADLFGLPTGIEPLIVVEEEHIWPSLLHAGQFIHLSPTDRPIELYDQLGRSIATLQARNGLLHTPTTLVAGRYWLRSIGADGLVHRASFVIE